MRNDSGCLDLVTFPRVWNVLLLVQERRNAERAQEVRLQFSTRLYSLSYYAVLPSRSTYYRTPLQSTTFGVKLTCDLLSSKIRFVVLIFFFISCGY